MGDNTSYEINGAKPPHIKVGPPTTTVGADCTSIDSATISANRNTTKLNPPQGVGVSCKSNERNDIRYTQDILLFCFRTAKLDPPHDVGANCKK